MTLATIRSIDPFVGMFEINYDYIDPGMFLTNSDYLFSRS